MHHLSALTTNNGHEKAQQHDGSHGTRAWVAAAGTSEASSTALATIRISVCQHKQSQVVRS